ncbi:hypothetical protein [Vibrio mexicanus]|uniref:hypothetical protein n=1 Tax=Vibrio mexicanus TaxID=1004326 RepID=UPI00063C9DEF|nr:hypothetical protein [Vibrio mexicanus]
MNANLLFSSLVFFSLSLLYICKIIVLNRQGELPQKQKAEKESWAFSQKELTILKKVYGVEPGDRAFGTKLIGELRIEKGVADKYHEGFIHSIDGITVTLLHDDLMKYYIYSSYENSKYGDSQLEAHVIWDRHNVYVIRLGGYWMDESKTSVEEYMGRILTIEDKVLSRKTDA